MSHCARPGCNTPTDSFVVTKRGKDYCSRTCAFQDGPNAPRAWTHFHTWDEALAKCPTHMKVLGVAAVASIAWWALL